MMRRVRGSILSALDVLGDLVAGRRPLTDYDQLVKDWQSNGGEQIRAELEQQLAARGKA